MIVVAVEQHDEEIGIRYGPILSRHPVLDLALVPHPSAHIDVFVVVEKSDLRLLADRRALVGDRLPELRDRRRRHPQGLVQPSVDHRRPGCPDGHCMRGHGVVGIRSRSGGGAPVRFGDRLGRLGRHRSRTRDEQQAGQGQGGRKAGGIGSEHRQRREGQGSFDSVSRAWSAYLRGSKGTDRTQDGDTRAVSLVQG